MNGRFPRPPRSDLGAPSVTCDHPRCPEIWISKLSASCCSPSPLPCSPRREVTYPGSPPGERRPHAGRTVAAPPGCLQSCFRVVCPRDPAEPVLSSPYTGVRPSAGARPVFPPEVARVAFLLGNLGARPALPCTPRRCTALGATAPGRAGTAQSHLHPARALPAAPHPGGPMRRMLREVPDRMHLLRGTWAG